MSDKTSSPSSDNYWQVCSHILLMAGMACSDRQIMVRQPVPGLHHWTTLDIYILLQTGRGWFGPITPASFYFNDTFRNCSNDFYFSFWYFIAYTAGINISVWSLKIFCISPHTLEWVQDVLRGQTSNKTQSVSRAKCFICWQGHTRSPVISLKIFDTSENTTNTVEGEVC